MRSQDPLFTVHKSRILAGIASPSPDASPKGSVDIQILPLINRLNQHGGVFTTSSCSGRISIFLEGLKKASNSSYLEKSRQGDSTPEAEDPNDRAGIGGKGGGKWLFVSHDPVDVDRKSDWEVAEMLLGGEVEDPRDEERYVGLGLGSGDSADSDISSTTRFVHLKFEPMILHVQTSDLQTAQAILTAALSAGFRESGIMNPGLGASSFPMVAIRCNGLAMDSIIGIVGGSNERIKKLVDNSYLKTLVKICNLRFEDNERRIEKFTANTENALFGDGKEVIEAREDKAARRLRKRGEGLKKQRELKAAQDIKITAGDGTATP